MVIERLQVQCPVDVQVAVAGDGVAESLSVLQLSTARPGIGRIIGGVAVHPVENRQLVQRQLVTGSKCLPVVQRRAEVHDAVLHRVLPDGVEFGIEILVDRCVLAVGFLYLCTCGTLEVHVQVLRQVPTELEVTVPQHLTVEVDGQVRVLRILQVTLLQFIIGTRHLGVEGDGLRQVVQSQGLGEVQPLRLTLDLLEGFPRLVDGRVGVVQGTAPLVVVLVDSGLAGSMAMLVTVADGEVGRVVGHGVTLRLDADAGIGKREVT